MDSPLTVASKELSTLASLNSSSTPCYDRAAGLLMTGKYRTARGQPVVNHELFHELDTLMTEYEENDIPVWFWHARREFNQNADRLANEAPDAAG